MRGRIYTDQKCPVCGSSYVHEDRRRGLFCPNHPEQEATRAFTVQFGRKLRKRFKGFREAERFLDGLRYEVDRGTFDARDYLTSNPLSFTTLSTAYLKKKKDSLAPGSYSHYKRYIKTAQEYFKDTNVKQIQYAQLEDYMDTIPGSGKTRACYLECLKTFFKWLVKRREIDKGSEPEFPEIRYELGYRRTVGKEIQFEILKEVKRISFHVSPKIWLGIKWLITYISVRPAELRNIKEGHIDRREGYILIPHPKEKKPKIVPLISEDIEILNELPRGLPELHFFRHGKNVSGVRPGERFGKNVFYKWWKRACENLGIEGVDLYGGTRHSSTVSLRDHATPEQIKRATMHSTNKAFERYFQVSREELEKIYERTSCDTPVIRVKETKSS